MAVLGRTGQGWSPIGTWRRVASSRWTKLTALCVGLNLLEASLVTVFQHGAHPDMAPQANAIVPFGVFGDLRWISVYHDSWAAVAGELAAMLVVRGGLTALSIVLAWPSQLPPPTAGTALRRGVCATALSAVLLLPSVTLLFGLAVLPVSWLFLAAVPTALLVAYIVHPAAVSGDWWRRLAAPKAIGWVSLAFIVLSLGSALMAAAPSALWPLVAALCGLFNAWSWVGLVHAVVDRSPARHMVPVAGLAALALVGTVVGGTVLGFNLARNAEARPLLAAEPQAVSRADGPAVLIVSGYGSSWDGQPSRPIPGDFLEERFSYRGLGAGGEPLPYASSDTAKPIAQLDRMLLAQVASLHARTGRQVAVVAESEGALVAKTAILASPAPDVAVLVMASPLESPGRVSYPTSGESGWGVASSAAMRLISDAFEQAAPIDLSPDNPLFASLDHQAPVVENAMACPIPGVRQFALLPLADATVTPATEKLPFPSVVLPAFHGGLLETASGQKIVDDVLENRPVNQDELLTLADYAIRYAASGWQVPSLASSDYPGAVRGAPSGTMNCDQVAAELHRDLFG